MIWLIEYFGTITGRLVLGAGIVASLVALRAWDVHHQRGIGERKAVAKIEKANDNATKLGKRAAAGSTDSGMRGKRDPSTRDD